MKPDTAALVLLAAEASGELLGARLMKSLKAQGFQGRFYGLGGDNMLREGLKTFYPLKDVSFVAFTDVLLNGFVLLWRVRQVANKIIALNPQGVVLIDSYDLNHRIARSVFRRAPHIKLINYVPPKAWAWRKGRAKTMKKYIKHCLTLLPFEAGFFQKAGIPSTYVGHPALEHIATPKQAEAFRAAHASEDKKIILVALGSRNVEFKHLSKIFAKTLPLIQEQMPRTQMPRTQLPHAQFFMPVAETMKDKIEETLAGWAVQPTLIHAESEKQALFVAADVALVASGTITLELGLSNTAAICVYRIGWIEEKIISWLANIELVHLVNLVLQKAALPQFLGGAAEPQALADATIKLLKEESKAATATLTHFKQKMEMPQAPSAMAAQKVLALIAE